MEYNINDYDLWDLGEYDFISLLSDDYSTRKMRTIIRNFFPDVEFFRGYDICRREPSHYVGFNYKHDVAQSWHQDDSDWPKEKPDDEWIVVWSTFNPTELQRPNGKVVYKCLPNHLYIFDNRKWMHREPRIRVKKTNTNYKRYFIRYWIKKDELTTVVQ